MIKEIDGSLPDDRLFKRIGLVLCVDAARYRREVDVHEVFETFLLKVILDLIDAASIVGEVLENLLAPVKLPLDRVRTQPFFVH